MKGSTEVLPNHHLYYNLNLHSLAINHIFLNQKSATGHSFLIRNVMNMVSLSKIQNRWNYTPKQKTRTLPIFWCFHRQLLVSRTSEALREALVMMERLVYLVSRESLVRMDMDSQVSRNLSLDWPHKQVYFLHFWVTQALRSKQQFHWDPTTK